MDGGGRTRRRQGEERRQSIIDAALRLFGQRGFDGTSIRDIAREVGVTEGLLYHYFASKADLVQAICRERGWQARMGEVMDRTASMPLRDALRELTRAFLGSLLENRHIVRLLGSELHRNPPFAELHLRDIEANREALAASLEARQRSGEIRQGIDLNVPVGLLLGSAYSLFLLWGEAPTEQWERESRALLGDGVDLVARALGNDDPGGESTDQRLTRARLPEV